MSPPKSAENIGREPSACGEFIKILICTVLNTNNYCTNLCIGSIDNANEYVLDTPITQWSPS